MRLERFLLVSFSDNDGEIVEGRIQAEFQEILEQLGLKPLFGWFAFVNQLRFFFRDAIEVEHQDEGVGPTDADVDVAVVETPEGMPLNPVNQLDAILRRKRLDVGILE